MASRWGKGNGDVGSAAGRRRKESRLGSPQGTQDRVRAPQGNREYRKDLLCYSFKIPLHFFICPSEQPRA